MKSFFVVVKKDLGEWKAEARVDDVRCTAWAPTRPEVMHKIMDHVNFFLEGQDEGLSLSPRGDGRVYLHR